MEQNKTGKYIKYAIGEIALVMVGILLALQVNNWNETRKQNSLERMYLERMSFELTNDTVYFNQMMLKSKRAIESLKMYVNESYEIQKTKEDVKKLFNKLIAKTNPLKNQ